MKLEHQVRMKSGYITNRIYTMYLRSSWQTRDL